MPDVLPTINNEPAQGIQALLDTTYLWNPDVANDLIEQINALLEKLDEVTNSIPPYSELEAPVKQYQPCYNGDNVYVAAADMDTLPATFDPAQWILIATKAPVLQAGAGIDISGNEISVEQQVLSDAAAGATAVQPEDLATVATSGSYNDLNNKPTLGTAAYASTSDFATAAQGGKADTAVQPGDLGTAAYAATTDFATAAQGTLADTAVQPSDLAAVATSGSYTDLSNKPAIDGVTLTSQTTKADIGLAGVYKYKGSVATYADLANIQSPEVGDVYNVEDTGDNYAWTGTEWDQLGGTFVPPVTSVNSKTGAVVLSAKDVGAIPQYSTMPAPSQAGDIVQYVGTSNQNYTNGYFYQAEVVGEEIADGECDVDIETFQGGNDEEDLPPPTFDLDFSVLESYLASRSKPQITSPIVDIMVEYNQYNNLVIWLEYNKDEDAGTHESVEVVTSGDTIADTVSGLATLGFTVDLTGFTYLSYADLTLPTEDVSGWAQKDVQPNPDETHNKISHTFMYDEDNPISIANIRLKDGQTAKLKIRAYEAFDNGEGEITPGSELFNIDVFLDDAKYLLNGDSGNSRCLYSKLGNVGYLSCDISGTYDGYYQLWTQCYGEYEPDEKKYSIFEIEYSDGVDSFEFSAEEGGYIEVATGYTGLNPTGCRQEFPDFFEDYAPGGIMPVIEAGGTMTWKKYPFDDLYTGLNNQILVTENGGFANKWASQTYDMTMPEPPHILLDPVAIFQYLGETDQDYTQGYFYKIAAVGQRNATIISTQGSALGNITIDQDKFADFLKSQGIYWNSVSDYIRMVGQPYNVYWDFRGTSYTKADLEDVIGISYDGYASNGNYIEIGWDDPTFEWQQVNTQPEPVIPDPLPSQSGQSGKFLTTDGTDASWATVDALPSQAGNAGKMLVTNGTTASWATPTTVTFRTWGANE